MMTVEEARQVTWNYSGYPEPIGKLISEGKLSARHLRSAAENATNPRIREAAQTLLIHVIDPPSREISRDFGPEVVSGSHYLQVKEKQGIFRAFFYLIAPLVALVLSITVGNTLFGMPVMGLVNGFVWIPLTAWCVRQFGRSLDEAANYRAGRKAEESVVDIMRSSLDSSWTVFKNLRLPASRGDVDILLVSRQGLWAIEVKALNGVFRLRDGELEKWNKFRWAVVTKKPGKQVRGNAVQVREHFSNIGSLRWVQSVLVMWAATSTSIAGYNNTELWTRANLKENLQKLKGQSYLSRDDYEHVIKTLKELAVQSATT